MLLLLKESMKEDRYIKESSHIKNVEAVMAFKKSCGNTIKVCAYFSISLRILSTQDAFTMDRFVQFSKQNIPYAVIQVKKIK